MWLLVSDWLATPGLDFKMFSFRAKVTFLLLTSTYCVFIDLSVLFVLLQRRKSVKIIGGDETEPSKVAHIISRKFATEFLGNLGNTFVISAQKQVASKKKTKKKKVFIEIESHPSAKIGNSNVFSAQN